MWASRCSSQTSSVCGNPGDGLLIICCGCVRGSVCLFSLHLTHILADVINILLLALMATELLLRASAFGLRAFIRNPWNIFDCVLLVGSLLSVFLAVSVYTSWARIFRLLRVLRLVRFVPSLYELLRTLLYAILGLLFRCTLACAHVSVNVGEDGESSSTRLCFCASGCWLTQ